MGRPLNPAERVALETLAEGLRNQINDNTTAGIRDVGRPLDSAKVAALLYPNGVPQTPAT